MYTSESRLKYLYISLILILGFRLISTKPSFVDGQRIRVTSYLLSNPRPYGNQKIFAVNGISMVVPGEQDLEYYDKVIAEGQYRDGKLIVDKIIEIKKSNLFLVRLRERLVSFYRKVLPANEAALVAGIVFGAREDITRDFREQLRRSGTTHVIVASGTNVTLLAGFLVNIFVGFFKRRVAITITIGVVFVYIFLVGLEAPIVRAFLMFTVCYIAILFGRVINPGRILIFVGLIMLILNPFYVSDLGFALSFAATAGLVLFENKISTRVKVLPGVIRESFSASLATQIATFPILLIGFGYVSLVAPIANVLVLWSVPIITISASIAGAIGIVLPTLGKYLTIIFVYPPSAFFVGVVNFFGRLGI